MKRILISLTAMLALAAANAWAKAPPDATGECKDGTYTTAAQKEGACSSHGGVKKWLAKEDKGGKAEKAAKSSDKASKAAEKPAAAAAKPADATGECKDGTYTTSATKSGACAGHKGVKTWYGGAKKEAESKAPAKSAAASKPAAAPPAAPAPAAAPASAPSSAKSTASAPASERTAAAGGGAGKVWVNTDSKVYHCEKDALYGKTKQGEYMTEAQAKASGARPSRGKACS